MLRRTVSHGKRFGSWKTRPRSALGPVIARPDAELAGVGGSEAGDQAQQRGFSAAARPDEGDHLSRLDGERTVSSAWDWRDGIMIAVKSFCRSTTRSEEPSCNVCGATI